MSDEFAVFLFWLVVAALAVAAVLFVLYVDVVVAAPLAAAVATVVTLWVVMIEFTAAVSRTFQAGAPIDHLGIAPAAEEDSGGQDPAYRSYYFGPVLRDLSLALRSGRESGWVKAVSGPTSLTKWITGRFGKEWIANVFWFPPVAGGVIGVCAGMAVAALIIGVAAGVFSLFVVLLVLGAVVVAGLLRVVETVALRLRGITLECGNCHRRIVAPVYECVHCVDGDRARHRRLVPGSLGVLSRTCRCGGALPTLLARGKWKLPGFCHHEGCGWPLPAKGLTTPTFHVPVVAGTTAGKTVFMTAAIADLRTGAQSEKGPPQFEFADETAADKFAQLGGALSQGRFDGIKATLPGDALRAATVYLGAEGRRGRRLFYLYDAAGERYQTADRLNTFRFLGFTAGVVLIVDPFALETVRDKLEPELLPKHSNDDPGDVFSRFAAGLRENRGMKTNRPIKVPAAVVLTKCDVLLASTRVPHPYDELGAAAADENARAARSVAVRSWLRDGAGQGGPVSELENSFGRCSYFAISALDAFAVQSRPSARTTTATRNDAPAAPLTWLLSRPSRSERS